LTSHSLATLHPTHYLMTIMAGSSRVYNSALLTEMAFITLAVCWQIWQCSNSIYFHSSNSI